jgi:hypothetical protein
MDSYNKIVNGAQWSYLFRESITFTGGLIVPKERTRRVADRLFTKHAIGVFDFTPFVTG